MGAGEGDGDKRVRSLSLVHAVTFNTLNANNNNAIVDILIPTIRGYFLWIEIRILAAAATNVYAYASLAP